ncbi:GGDEF domain-containing protein [Vibrio proteolyticus]|uniref:diguanylate cyclase n=1 Tax=Vibrio proteolyticus NBRC 13287 TaxID=1219065 RepID=U2ZWT5_VIBPR|nr:GGDEF domain-containing protein [Vibrio proteolyticus]GAD65572.1 hypothetical protein VPR01S_01_03450 [Vibrio proteolyticus NBRC 13287]
MTLTDLDVLKSATILNNIASSGIAGLFVILVRNKLTHSKSVAASWFTLFFILLGLGYLTSIARAWVELIYSVATNNAFYQAASYALLFGVLNWYGRAVPRWLSLLGLAHIIAYTSLQICLTMTIPDSLELRVMLAALNHSAVFGVAALAAAKFTQSGRLGEKILTFSIAFSTALLYLPYIAMTQYDATIVYHSLSAFVQSILVISSLGAVLSLFFYDEIDWHYQRAIKDSLTGMFNRRYFIDKASQKVAKQSKPHLLAMLDLDHFKDINDSFGHESGDKVLQYLSQIFQKHFADEDLVARYGGEEFVVMLPINTQAMAYHKLDALRLVVEATSIPVEHGRVKVSMSIGTSIIEPGGDISTAIKEADIALYKAKEQGRNRLCRYLVV